MLARPRGARRPRTRGRLAPLALNGKSGFRRKNYALDTRESRLQSAHIVALSPISTGACAALCRGLTSIETTSTTGLRLQNGAARLSPRRRRRLPCQGPDLLDVGLVDACVGVSLAFATCRSGSGPHAMVSATAPVDISVEASVKSLGRGRGELAGQLPLGASRRLRCASGHRAVRNLRGDVAVGVPVHLHPRLDRPVFAAGGAESADQVGVGAWPGGSCRRPGRPARWPAERTRDLYGYRARTAAPPSWTAAVAVAWAMTAGRIGSSDRSPRWRCALNVASKGAPMTSQTNGLWLCSSFRDGNDRRSIRLGSQQPHRALSHSPLTSSTSWYPNMVTCQRMSTPSRGLYSNFVTRSRFTMVGCASRASIVIRCLGKVCDSHRGCSLKSETCGD